MHAYVLATLVILVLWVTSTGLSRLCENLIKHDMGDKEPGTCFLVLIVNVACRADYRGVEYNRAVNSECCDY